jgi:integrase
VLIETGFRISDVLNLKIKDIRRGKTITEKKTKKKRQLILPDALRDELLGYAKQVQLRSEDFLFPSTHKNLCRPLSRSQVYRVFKHVEGSISPDKVLTPHSAEKHMQGLISKNMRVLSGME